MVAPCVIWLCGASSAGCLITGEPDYSPPEPTEPSLKAVSPSPTELLVFRGTDNQFPSITFRAEVRSEDGDDLLEAVLLRDLGTPHDFGEGVIQPYVRAEASRPGSLEKGSLNDLAPREVSLTYDPVLFGPSACHSLTLQVMRSTRSEPHLAWCPATSQFARVTWFVALCEPGEEACDFNLCLTNQETEKAYCPTPEETEGTP